MSKFRHQKLQHEVTSLDESSLPKGTINESQFNDISNPTLDLSSESYMAKIMDRPSIIAEGGKMRPGQRKFIDR